MTKQNSEACSKNKISSSLWGLVGGLCFFIWATPTHLTQLEVDGYGLDLTGEVQLKSMCLTCFKWGSRMITGMCGSECNHENSFQALAHILSINISSDTISHMAKHKVKGNDIYCTIIKEVLKSHWQRSWLQEWWRTQIINTILHKNALKT